MNHVIDCWLCIDLVGGMSVCFGFTLYLISCDGYLIEVGLYTYNCNVNSMSFSWLHVIF